MGLKYLPLVGFKYTFFEGGAGSAWIRLDRFFIKNNFGWSKGLVQQANFKFSSDHVSIVHALKVLSSAPQPFQFFNMWCDHPNLKTLVKEEWVRNVNSNSRFRVKLNAARGAVRKSQGNQYNQTTRQIKEYKGKLQELLTGP